MSLTVRVHGTRTALARTVVPWNEPVRTRVTTGIEAGSARDRRTTPTRRRMNARFGTVCGIDASRSLGHGNRIGERGRR